MAHYFEKQGTITQHRKRSVNWLLTVHFLFEIGSIIFYVSTFLSTGFDFFLLFLGT